MTTIAVDAMGGDRGPESIVAGARQAVDRFGVNIILVGNESAIRQCHRDGWPEDRCVIHHTDEWIQMDESPLSAVRHKRQASVVVAANLVRDGAAAAFVSAGNTGAVMAAATLRIGRIPGIDRPAIATVLPTMTGRCVVLDCGANVDCKPDNLAEFALMGSLYAEHVLGAESPRVGLLSNGSEETKGDERTRQAAPLIRDLPVHFIGNVEGHDIAAGTADVIVCDGFVGNVLLKTAEGYARLFTSRLKGELFRNLRSRLGALLARPALGRFRQGLDYADYGGALLLGLSGGCIIAHGSSNPRAICNAVRVASEVVDERIVQRIADAMESLTLRNGQLTVS